MDGELLSVNEQLMASTPDKEALKIVEMTTKDLIT